MTVKPRAGADKSASIVLADVGGTNVRFAVLTGAALSPIEHLAVADYKNFVDALATFMSHQKDRGALRHALFGVAGLVEGGRCALTNNPWIVDTHELRARFGFTDVHIVNDFEAIAWSLPRFTSKDLHKLGGLEGKLNAPMLALGPGTGFGVAAYVPSEQGGFVLQTEGGHSTMPSGSARETVIVRNRRECRRSGSYPGAVWKIFTARLRHSIP